MDKLPVEVIRIIYEYDNTYKIKFAKVLAQLTAHCFIYNCRSVLSLRIIVVVIVRGVKRT